MSDSPTSPAQYRERVQAALPNRLAGPRYDRHSGVYFFLSLDLVNSTAFKERNRDDWQFWIRSFYDEAKNFWTNQQVTTRPTVWKYAGDEVLFYKRLRSVRDCQVAVQESYRALRSVSSTVRTWTEQRNPRMYVKGVCWAAHVEYKSPAPNSDLLSIDGPRNVVFESPMDLGSGKTLDFLGPEVDAGFRLSAGSIKNALVVSAELAHVVHTRGTVDVKGKIRLIDYCELKGVWDGRRYPILWYRDSWEADELDSEYDYDDAFVYGIVSKARSSNEDGIRRLDSILSQVRRRWLVELQLPSDSPDEDLSDTADALPAPEVHCVAVCFRDDGRVLLARRTQTKAVLPGMWEAGCARLQPGENFYDAMKRDYKADFNLELKFDCFRPWGVVGSYEFSKAGGVVPGVVFVASVENADTLAFSKHDRVEWFQPDNLPEEVTSACVPDLQDRVRRASLIWLEGRAAPAAAD